MSIMSHPGSWNCVHYLRTTVAHARCYISIFLTTTPNCQPSSRRNQKGAVLVTFTFVLSALLLVFTALSLIPSNAKLKEMGCNALTSTAHSLSHSHTMLHHPTTLATPIYNFSVRVQRSNACAHAGYWTSFKAPAMDSCI